MLLLSTLRLGSSEYIIVAKSEALFEATSFSNLVTSLLGSDKELPILIITIKDIIKTAINTIT